MIKLQTLRMRIEKKTAACILVTIAQELNEFWSLCADNVQQCEDKLPSGSVFFCRVKCHVLRHVQFVFSSALYFDLNIYCVYGGACGVARKCRENQRERFEN